MTMENQGQEIGMVAFKRLCKCYGAQKKLLEKDSLGNAKIDESGEAMIKDMHDRLLRRNVSIVERIFDRLEKAHGKEARLALWEMYVEGAKQPDVAQRHGFSLRTLQRNAATWVKECLEGEYA